MGTLISVSLIVLGFLSTAAIALSWLTRRDQKTLLDAFRKTHDGSGSPAPALHREVGLAREEGAAQVRPLGGAGADAVVQEIRAQGDRIVDAIREASAAQKASREDTANTMLQRGAGFLRDALDEGTPRTMVVEPGGADKPRVVTLTPPVANDADDADEDE